MDDLSSRVPAILICSVLSFSEAYAISCDELSTTALRKLDEELNQCLNLQDQNCSWNAFCRFIDTLYGVEVSEADCPRVSSGIIHDCGSIQPAEIDCARRSLISLGYPTAELQCSSGGECDELRLRLNLLTSLNGNVQELWNKAWDERAKNNVAVLEDAIRSLEDAQSEVYLASLKGDVAYLTDIVLKQVIITSDLIIYTSGLLVPGPIGDTVSVAYDTIKSSIANKELSLGAIKDKVMVAFVDIISGKIFRALRLPGDGFVSQGWNKDIVKIKQRLDKLKEKIIAIKDAIEAAKNHADLLEEILKQAKEGLPSKQVSKAVNTLQKQIRMAQSKIDKIKSQREDVLKVNRIILREKMSLQQELTRCGNNPVPLP